jgi:hypothetical protein
MINRRAAAAVAVTLALGALAAPASAAAQNAAVGGTRSQASASGMPTALHAVTAAHIGNALAAPPGAAALKKRSASPDFSSCGINFFGYAGAYICDTGVLFRYQANGALEEVFVIGTNWQIWHAWPGSNGWQSLGGAAQQTVPNNGVYQWSSNPYAIYTYGTDGRQWCDNWGTPAWGGWHLCQ